MKVECVRLVNDGTGECVDKNTWLTVGRVYQVLSVFIADGNPVEYRLIADDGHTPGMYKANQFKVISDVLPLNWVISHQPGSYFELAPKPWAEQGFWEKYFDGEPTAIQCFDSEKEKIIQFDP